MVFTPNADFFARIRVQGNPVAHPESVVICSHARFTVLTSRLIRMEWSASGIFEDRGTFAFPNRYAEPPRFATSLSNDELILDTGALVLRYRDDARPFSASNLSITFGLGAQPQVWRPGMSDLYNLRGTRRTLDGADGPVALEEGLISRAGWALFDDSRSVLFTTDNSWIDPRPDHDLQDWYFFGYGHDYTAALRDYTRFGGSIPLIPRFVLGVWWSRYWAYSAEDLRQLVHDFAAHELPLDVLVVDMDWHTPDGWTGYTWNRELFPDPSGFLRWVHAQGLRVTLNLHPADGVQPFEEVYPQFAAAMAVDATSQQPIPFRITDPRFVQNYFELLHHPLEEQGVDFWWMDWQQGETSEMKGLDPLPWINHLHFHDSMRRGLRPMLFSRWGKLGNHRYHIGFSGDTFAVWPALQSLPHFTAAAANVCYGWWSHDIGGHFGATDPELFARWVQYGALSPCLRLHASKQDEAERRPWAFPAEVLVACRAAFQLRYQLLPYLYTMARVMADTSVPLCRPLYYAYPEEDAAYVARWQYFLGDQIIAAPIVSPADPATGMAAVDVWLPAGEWIDFQTKERYQGPVWVRLLGDLDRVPLLVRAGGIIPLAPPVMRSDALPADHLILAIFPGATASFRYYEDDGVSMAYREGHYEWTPIELRMADAQHCEVLIGPVEGHCARLPRQRRYTLRLEATQPPSSVTLNGVPHHDWRYDAATLTTLIETALLPKDQPVTLHISGAGAIVADRAHHQQALRRADLLRLLGTRCPQQEGEDLITAVLALEGPGRADAIARLGGPFAHLIEYVAPEDARQQFGHAIVAAPADGSPCDVTVRWTMLRGSIVETQTTTHNRVTETQVLASPFAFDGTISAGYWRAEVTLAWRGFTLTTSHQSRPLFPAIPLWRVCVYDELADPLALDQVVGADGGLNPALNWQLYRQMAATVQNVNEIYRVAFYANYWARLAAGEPLAAYAVSTIISPDAREAAIYFTANGPIRFVLNGEPLEEQPIAEDDPLREVMKSFRGVRRTVMAQLRSGPNQLIAITQRPEGSSWWYFEAGCVSAAGVLANEFVYRV